MRNYPRFAFWVFVIGLVSLCLVGLCFFSLPTGVLSYSQFSFRSLEKNSIDVVFDLEKKSVPLVLPNIGEQICLYKYPMSPKDLSTYKYVLRLKKNTQEKKLQLPTTLTFGYDKGAYFSESGVFLVHLEISSPTSVLAQVSLKDSSHQIVQSFKFFVEDLPVTNILDLAKEETFRRLSEIQFIGTDWLKTKYFGAKEESRIVVKNQTIFNIKQNDFIVFSDCGVKICEDLNEQNASLVAKVISLDERGWLLDVWSSEEYARVFVPTNSVTLAKSPNTDFISNAKVRSEKQASCVFDKQYLVLKVGDFVVKPDSKWKILRTQLEKKAFSEKPYSGEVFVFDRIESRGSGKFIKFHLFSKYNSQLHPLEIAALTRSKVRGHENKVEKNEN